MRRAIMLGALAYACLAGDISAQEAEAPKVELVPDKSWTPEPGSQAVILIDGAPAAASEFTLDRFDGSGTTQAEGFRVRLLPRGTKVSVVKSTRPAPKLRVYTSGEDRERAIQNDINNTEEYAVVVKILEGVGKDETRFVSEKNVGRLVPIPARTGFKRGDRLITSEPGVPFQSRGSNLTLNRNTKMTVQAVSDDAYEIKVNGSKYSGRVGIVPTRDARIKIDDSAKPE